MALCPPIETLRYLGIRPEEGTGFEELERHIEQCASCQIVLERLAREPAAEPVLPNTELQADSLPTIPGFEIEAEIGRGGMGVVYRAWQPRLMRRVALKIVPSGPVTEAHKRWLNEARAVSCIRDPRVVQLHDVGEAGGWLYLTLEYIAGGSLKERLHGPLPADDAVQLVEEIALGVAAIHRVGILHLDLKPANILLDSEPGSSWAHASPKVADFGIARRGDQAATSLPSIQGPWGTPSYMAPEQVQGDRSAIGPAADVHALGAILYELLTGRPPFQAASDMETLDQVREQTPAPLRRLNRALPRDLETICSTCLQKDPSRRYATSEALASDLRLWREGRPIQARPVSTLEQAWRWSRRNPLPSTLVLALVITVVAAFTGLLWLYRRAEFQRSNAEHSRQIALANLESTYRSLAEITSLANSLVGNYIESLPDLGIFGDMLERVRAAQEQQFQLHRDEPAEIEQMAMLDHVLGVARSRRGRYEDAYLAAAESFELWEQRIRQGCDIRQARLRQVGPICILAICDKVRDPATVERWNSSAASILECLALPPAEISPILELARAQLFILNTERLVGHNARSRQYFERTLHILDSVVGEPRSSFEIRLSREITLQSLGRPVERKPRQAATPEQVRAYGQHRLDQLVREIAELVAQDLMAERTGGGLEEINMVTPSLDTQVRRTSEFLHDRCVAEGLDDTIIPKVGWEVGMALSSRGSYLRSHQKLSQAIDIARFFKAFSHDLINAYPDSPYPQLMLSEAFVQEAKNASRSDNQEEVWKATQSSLQAAEQAIRIDPGCEPASSLVNDRRKRLDRIRQAR